MPGWPTNCAAPGSPSGWEDNAWVEIADWKPAQALADEFPIQALNADLNALARQHEPFLKQFASGYYWSLMNRKWKRK
jgi:hypothetical protein